MDEYKALVNLIVTFLIGLFLISMYALLKGEWLITMLGNCLLVVIVLNYKLLLVPIENYQERIKKLENKIEELENRLE